MHGVGVPTALREIASVLQGRIFVVGNAATTSASHHVEAPGPPGLPVSRRLRLKARKLPDRNSYPVTEPFDPGSLSVAISSSVVSHRPADLQRDETVE
jgi:hypothetical protein